MYKTARFFLLTCTLSAYGASIASLQHLANQHAPYAQRAESISAAFIGKPYHAFLLGDGPSTTLDPRPLYNLSAFDCLTYVETVLALSHSYNNDTFVQQYIAVKYTGSTPRFSTRNHFTNIQWNTNAHQIGWLTDYTNEIKGLKQRPIAQLLSTNIDIPGWFNALASNDTLWHRYTQQHLTPDIQTQLQRLAHDSQTTRSIITYIPYNQLIDAYGSIPSAITEQLPPFSVVEFVRTNWPSNNTLGTHLDVSHIGFLIHTNDQVILRHASEVAGAVIEEDFGPYLQRLSKQPSFAGIHLERINN